MRSIQDVDEADEDDTQEIEIIRFTLLARVETEGKLKANGWCIPLIEENRGETNGAVGDQSSKVTITLTCNDCTHMQDYIFVLGGYPLP